MSGRDGDLPPRTAAFPRPERAAVDVLGTERMAQAALLLFRGGYDTVELAALFGLRESDVIDLLHRRTLARGT